MKKVPITTAVTSSLNPINLKYRFLGITFGGLLLFLGCGPTLEPEAASIPQNGELFTSPSEKRITTSNPAPPHSKTLGSSGQFDTVFEFHKNLDRAHYRRGGLVINFGNKSRHKYTLGDGESGFLGDYESEGRSYSNIRYGISHILFDMLPDELSDGTLILNGRGRGSDRVYVYLNGVELGWLVFGSDGWATDTVEFENDLLKQGENEIHLECKKKDSEEQQKVCLSIDYLKIVPSALGFPSTDGEYPQNGPFKPGGEEDAILLNEGDSLTFNLPIPEGGRILFEEVLPRRGITPNLEISASIDGESGPVVSELEIDSKTRNAQIPLEYWNPGATSLTFRAIGGDIEIKNSRLIVSRKEVPETAATVPRAKNFVLVVIDTLRTDRLTLYNKNTRVRTPALQAIASSSTVFDRAHSQASWTKPSVSSLLTGLYPSTHTVQRHLSKIPDKVVLASEHFRSLGFTTAGLVANGYISTEFGFEKGWDYWKNYGKEELPKRAINIFQDAADWLRGNIANTPFFLYVHTVDPHAPYDPPSRFLKAYDSNEYSGSVEPKQTADLLKRIRAGEIEVSKRDVQRLEALYDGEISYHDTHLAKLLDAMVSLRLTEDTLLVITSDHGEEFFDHGGVGHSHSLFEELIHVPLIIRIPGSDQNLIHRCTVDVQLVDVLPTACEILSVECPKGIQGQSLVPFINGRRFDGYPRAAYAELPDMGLHSIRMGDLKAIYINRSPTHYELFKDKKELRAIGAGDNIARAMLRDSLGLHLSQFSGSTVGQSEIGRYVRETASISRETSLQLKALGYIDD